MTNSLDKLHNVFDPIVEALRQDGVDKSFTEVVQLYRKLVRQGQWGIYTEKAANIRRLWPVIHGLKTFLTDKGLIQLPLDLCDEFYHIPNLEDGFLTFADLQKFLGQYESEELTQYHLEPFILHPNRKAWARRFAEGILPKMLSREVWEHIAGRC
jgi:hypothetical protein